MIDNMAASFQHETLRAGDGRRITRYAHGAVFFHWQRDPADAVYVCQARRWQANGEEAPWNWRLVPPPPAPPQAAIRMITADYQAGGEYDIRARERASGADAGAWANGKVFFLDGMATLSNRDDGADEKNATYDLKAVNSHKQAETDARAPEELLKIIEAKGREIPEALKTLSRRGS